jgi:epoxyqueuosine reductase
MLSIAALREEALSLGFDLVGIAPAGPAPHGDDLMEWVERGFGGDMAYMTRTADARADTGVRFPWAKSVLCVAMSYPSPGIALGEPEEAARGNARRTPPVTHRSSPVTHGSSQRGASGIVRGRVSCYARGDDYHDVMGRKLAELEVFALEHGATRTKPYVDTGPVLERDWAARAGLGWTGKNTMLINQTLGSWLFLGTILLDLELDADKPFPDRCGTCTKCIDACPTGALVAPYLLDSRLCISYLTIEHKGMILQRLRPLIGDWVFGCDICQRVCPWNNKAHSPEKNPFAPRPGLDPLDLEWALKHPDELSELTANTPVERAKGNRLLRNIIVAAGNSRAPQLARALEAYAVGPPPELAEHVSWALRRLRG